MTTNSPEPVNELDELDLWIEKYCNTITRLDRYKYEEAKATLNAYISKELAEVIGEAFKGDRPDGTFSHIVVSKNIFRKELIRRAKQKGYEL